MAQECNQKINSYMKLMEMFDTAVAGYQDLESDNSGPKWKESRKTKLTLCQLRKLRKMLDVRNWEAKQNLKRVHAQYSVPAEQGAGGAQVM